MEIFVLFFLSIFVLLTFYFMAYKAKPAKDKNGHSITPPKRGFKTQKTDRLIIGTYNVQSGKDVDGKRDILRSAEIVKNADIVGIQEVYAKTWWGSKNQTQCLAEHSDFGWLFAATRRRWFREHRGNGLLSRLPVKKWTIEMLPDATGKQYRNLITAFIHFNNIDVAVLITHLHTKKGREQQLTFVLEKFKQYEHAILMGDMNTVINHPAVQDLLNSDEFIDSIQTTLPDNDTDKRIDWILTRGFEAHEGKSEPIGISDHPYYQVELSVYNNVQ